MTTTAPLVAPNPCVHYYDLEEAGYLKLLVSGVCRKCGLQGEFPAQWDESDWMRKHQTRKARGGWR